MDIEAEVPATWTDGNAFNKHRQEETRTHQAKRGQ